MELWTARSTLLDTKCNGRFLCPVWTKLRARGGAQSCSGGVAAVRRDVLWSSGSYGCRQSRGGGAPECSKVGRYWGQWIRLGFLEYARRMGHFIPLVSRVSGYQTKQEVGPGG